MKKDILQTNFLRILTGFYPNKTDLVKKLVEVLEIEKEAIYRRLRGEVLFCLSEVMLIAKELGISLDNLIGIDITKARPFSLGHVDFEHLSDKDYELCESRIRLIKAFRKNRGHCIETWNTLPIPLVYKYPWLTKFYLFKWIYQFKNHPSPRKLNEINIPERLKELEDEDFDNYIYLSHIEYIFSSTLFEDLVESIEYFYSVGSIQKEEIVYMHDELLQFVSFLENIAREGSFGPGKSKFSLYISEINIDLNHCYLRSDILHICMFRFLGLTAISSIDGLRNENIETWLMGQKRLSKLISESGEGERVRFFTTQRHHIQNLLNIGDR